MKTANFVGGPLFCPQRNSRGQSLIQVIVAVAILGIVSLGFMTMISQVMQAQKLAQARQDLLTLSNDVQTAFANPTACQQALGAKGVAFEASKASVIFPPAQGSTFANNGLPFSMQLNAQDTLKDNTTLKTYNLIANHVELVNAQPVGNDPSGNPVYKANIIGQFSPQGTGGHGLSDFATRQLAAGYFAVSGGNITGCSTSDLTNPFLSGGATGSTAAAACTLIGGTMTTQLKNVRPVRISRIFVRS